MLLRFLFVLACVAAAGVRPARADNLADESELEFELGADCYKAGDFRGALEHFLASNRLVPNPNVVFNIARTYEQLKQSADAYRYFSQALEGETDEPTRARINEALTRTLPQIAVVHIESDPPGATVYVGRRELGPRGNTPLVLGLTPGNYKIMPTCPATSSPSCRRRIRSPGPRRTSRGPSSRLSAASRSTGRLRAPRSASMTRAARSSAPCPARPTCHPAGTPSSSRRRGTRPRP